MWIIWCIFACLGRGVFGSLAEELAETTQLCCNQGTGYARNHSLEDCSSSVLPDVPQQYGTLCLFAMDQCCKEYFLKKRDCDQGMQLATTKHNCSSSKDTAKLCCDQCVRGSSSELCSYKPRAGSSAEELLAADAFGTCCKETVKSGSSEEFKSSGEIEKSTHLMSTVASSSAASLCEDYAPNELCAHHCIPVPGSYKCECNPGYKLMSDRRNCMEIVQNRCKPRNPCQHKCIDNGIEVKCSCRRGYKLKLDGRNCEDIDECQLEPPVCLPNTDCLNIKGSYKCIPKKNSNKPQKTPEKGQCPSGFTWNIVINACDDINECNLAQPPCPKYLCENTIGGYKCGGVTGDPASLPPSNRMVDDRCPPGFSFGISGQCEDIDECELHKDDCNPLSQFCINTRGSYHCQNHGSKHCPPGFKIDPRTDKCEDINECEDGQDICRPDQICINVLGEYDCKPRTDSNRFQNKIKCPDGMRLKPQTGQCEDIDECLEGTHLCDQHQNCLNTNGSHECLCKLGFELDPTTGACMDINECATNQHNCIPGSQRCDNTVGSFLCIRMTSCGTGYILQHTTGTCEDIDECALGTHNCDRAGPNYQCENHPGSFRCVRKRTATSTTSTLPPEYYEYYESEEEFENETITAKKEPFTNKPPTTTLAPTPEPLKPDVDLSQPIPSVPQPDNNLDTPEKTSQSKSGDANKLRPDEFSRTESPSSKIPRQPVVSPKQKPIEPHIEPDEEPKPFVPQPLEPRPMMPETVEPEPEPTRPNPLPVSIQPVQPQLYASNYFPTQPKSESEPTPNQNQPEQTTEQPEPGIIYYEPRNPIPFEPKKDHIVPLEPNKKVQEPDALKPKSPKNQPDHNTYFLPPPESPDNPVEPIEPKSPPPTPPQVYNVDVKAGEETAIISGEKKTDGSVVVDTGDIPKNEWTKIKEKPNIYCQPGFEPDDEGICIDIDECASYRHTCSGLTELCRNTMGGYLCECASSFRRDLITGACTLISNPVIPLTTSTEKSKSFFWGYPEYRPIGNTRPFKPRSMCDVGFHYNSQTGVCDDINECTNGQANCADVELCINTVGGYRCECPPNWTLDTVRHKCVPSRSQGVFPPGYANEPDSTNPKDFVNGFNAPKFVEPQVKQVEDRGAVITCPSGYKLGYDNTCEDIDECSIGQNKCGNMVCTNLPGGYICSCPPGHKLVDNNVCEDVDECALGGNKPVCSQNADCLNTVGSYQCKCHKGFRSAPVNDKVCVDVDECTEHPSGSLCQHRCNNVWGGYRCSCFRGYRLNPADNSTCTDIDECTEYKSKILCVGRCVNDPGSYHCTCPPGYRLSEDKKSCIDIDECETGEATCAKGGVYGSTSDVCLNTRGGYRCHRITCPPGYKLESKHRCTRIEKVCPASDWECAHQPTTYSYNFITFVSNLYIPESKVDLFTMRGPAWPNAKMRFQLRLVDVNAPPSVKDKADINAFLLVHTGNQAVMSLVRPLTGPQSIELELSMELYNGDQFGGMAVARIYIYVSEYEF